MKKSVVTRIAQPFQRSRLHDQVVRHLALRLLGGSSDDGPTTLPREFDLCRELHVSRTVLREAIKVLAAKGIVEVRPRTGMRLRPRGDWNLSDPDVLEWQCEIGVDEHFVENICEVRHIFEPAAAELAALRATPEEIVELDRWYREMEKNVENIEASIAADLQFHSRILAASHNELLVQVTATIGASLRLSRSIDTQLPEPLTVALPWHRDILEAIRSHDAPGARAAMDYHLRQTRRKIRQVLRLEMLEPVS